MFSVKRGIIRVDVEIKPFLENINSGSRKLILNPHRKGQSSPMVMAFTLEYLGRASPLLLLKKLGDIVLMARMASFYVP